jgi:hypothetical protein
MENKTLLQELIYTITSTPNDQELGKKIRNLFNNLKLIKEYEN